MAAKTMAWPRSVSEGADEKPRSPFDRAPGQPLAVSRLPFLNFMPSEGEEFVQAAYIAIPAVGASVNVIQFIVPAGRNCIVNRLANVFVGGGWVEGSGDVVWQLLAQPQNRVIPTFDNIVASLGSVSNPSILNGIRFREAELVTLAVKNVAVVVAGQKIGGRLGGYFYPSDLEPATLGF